MTCVSISQPTLFPWIGYFNIIKNSDVFIFLDNVKFEKRSWQMRNRLKSIQAEREEPVWINIPTTIKNSNIILNDVKIDNSQNWKRRHLQSFRVNYGKNFQNLEFLVNMYEQEWEKLVDFNINFITNCCEFLGIHTKLFRASEQDVVGSKSGLLLNICKKFNATEYLSTIGAKDYLENDKDLFLKENIEIKYHEYLQPKYKQNGKKFLEKLSILDLLFNEISNSKKFI
tara:strand:- start:2264 stop:2947 length:684 start_codon:yes stop_codon:yes gene_type:complete